MFLRQTKYERLNPSGVKWYVVVALLGYVFRSLKMIFQILNPQSVFGLKVHVCVCLGRVIGVGNEWEWTAPIRNDKERKKK